MQVCVWRGLGKQEAEWTKKVKIKNIKFWSVSEAHKAMFFPTPDLTVWTSDMPGFSAQRSLNSTFPVPSHKKVLWGKCQKQSKETRFQVLKSKNSFTIWIMLSSPSKRGTTSVGDVWQLFPFIYLKGTSSSSHNRGLKLTVFPDPLSKVGIGDTCSPGWMMLQSTWPINLLSAKQVLGSINVRCVLGWLSASWAKVLSWE